MPVRRLRMHGAVHRQVAADTDTVRADNGSEAGAAADPSKAVATGERRISVDDQASFKFSTRYLGKVPTCVNANASVAGHGVFITVLLDASNSAGAVFSAGSSRSSGAGGRRRLRRDRTCSRERTCPRDRGRHNRGSPQEPQKAPTRLLDTHLSSLPFRYCRVRHSSCGVYESLHWFCTEPILTTFVCFSKETHVISCILVMNRVRNCVFRL